MDEPQKLSTDNSLLIALMDKVQGLQLTLESLRPSLQKIDSIHKILFGNGDVEKSLVVRVDRLEQRNLSIGNAVNRLIYPLGIGFIAFLSAILWALVSGRVNLVP